MIVFMIGSILEEARLSVRTFPDDVAVNSPQSRQFNTTLIQFHPPLLSKTGPASSIKESVLLDVDHKGGKAYLAVVTNAISRFQVKGSCSRLQKTSAVASRHKCRHAMNGGPFKSFWGGGCFGPTVMHGHTINRNWNASHASFGATKDSWLIGHLSHDFASKYDITEAVTGFGWLVKDGVPSPTSEGGLPSRRSAIGINRKGDLMMLQVDGDLSLFQTAQLFISQGGWHAINLDGGGSSTTVMDGKVMNSPECSFLGFPCEPSVASVLCVV